MMKPIVLLLLNTSSLLLTLLVNYLYSSGNYGGPSVGEISSNYPTLITPAGYAFAIWGIIYLLLVFFVAFQWYTHYKNSPESSILPSGIWLLLANITNALWVFVWTQEWLFLSVLVISFLLFSLIKLVASLKLEIWDAPLRIIAFVWWPICIYTGWVILATVLNIAVWLQSMAILEGIGQREIWAVLVILIATLIYYFLVKYRNMREAAVVGAWGLMAIAINQWNEENAVMYAAVSAAIILLILAGWHGSKNFDTSPIMKYKRGEI